MNIIDKLAFSLNRRDEVPNQELAKKIVTKKDANAVKELVDLLKNKNKDIQNDCIKVLYEIGGCNPALIKDYMNEFISLLSSKNNRLQWGAMTALGMIATVNPKGIHLQLPKIMNAADNGSVITRDHAVKILVTLCNTKQYGADAFSLLIEQLRSCPSNQLPMYAENAAPVISEKNRLLFVKTIHSRLNELEKDSQRKRVEKLIKKITSV